MSSSPLEPGTISVIGNIRKIEVFEGLKWMETSDWIVSWKTNEECECLEDVE